MQDIRGSVEPAFTPASSSKHVQQLIPRAAPFVLSLWFRKHTLKPLNGLKIQESVLKLIVEITNGHKNDDFVPECCSQLAENS